MRESSTAHTDCEASFTGLNLYSCLWLQYNYEGFVHTVYIFHCRWLMFTLKIILSLSIFHHCLISVLCHGTQSSHLLFCVHTDNSIKCYLDLLCNVVTNQSPLVVLKGNVTVKSGIESLTNFIFNRWMLDKTFLVHKGCKNISICIELYSTCDS